MKTFRLICIALGVAIVAVLAQIQFPLPSGVPVTMQVFAVALIGYTLGAVDGLIVVAIYILMGAVGVPVFAGFKGGAVWLTYLTGGFIWGFLPMVTILGLGREKKIWLAMSLGVVGLLICHIIGIGVFSLISGNGIWASAIMVSVPYLLKDIISIVLAYIVAREINKVITKQRK